MRRSRIGWAFGVVAPWCLGLTLVVSATADAGQDASLGASRAALTALPAPAPDDLVPTGAFGLDVGLLRARLIAGERVDLASTLLEEIEPRIVLKPRAGAFPKVHAPRAAPLSPLAPSFDARLRAPGGLAAARTAALAFAHDEDEPVSAFAPETDAPVTATTFEAWPQGEEPVTQRSRAQASPGAAGTTVTRAVTALDGATPAVPRAVALNSTTPAGLEAAPVEIALGLRAAPVATLAPRSPARTDFAALLGSEQGAREEKCLAEAVYFEARSEPEAGQAAVAQVVLNRVASGLYPPSVCGVVYQNRRRHNACQFSFACEGRALRVTEPESWRTATRIAHAVAFGRTYLSDVGGSTHYHADYVRPRWARRLKKMDVIGRHIFYQLRPGQT